MSIQISTRYESRPNSNVGKYVARALGKQRAHTTDHRLTSEENHRAAARLLVEKLVDDGILPAFSAPQYVDSTEDGIRRTWVADGVPTDA